MGQKAKKKKKKVLDESKKNQAHAFDQKTKFLLYPVKHLQHKKKKKKWSKQNQLSQKQHHYPLDKPKFNKINYKSGLRD